MFVTEREALLGPRWIINFPTKRHWRHPSKIEWIEQGLEDLKRVIVEKEIRSIALPPLGTGNGGLQWSNVLSLIESALGQLPEVEVLVFEPTSKYQNVSKRAGVKELTPARALIAELIRRYWVLGLECSLLEVQKLAYFLERTIEEQKLANPLDLQFAANKFGPYADRLRHLLDRLDGSYLHCDRRLADAGPLDVIWFDNAQRDTISAYINSGEAKTYKRALEATAQLIDGFQSPLGMELLATVDWLIHHEGIQATVKDVKSGLGSWPGGASAIERKRRLFDDRLIELALRRLQKRPLTDSAVVESD